MRLVWTRSVIAGTSAAMVALFAVVGCKSNSTPPARQATPKTASAPQQPRSDTAHVADTAEAGGEVVSDAQPAVQPVVARWITDANVLSLLSTMNAKQIAAANVELSAWHSDTVRAFASAMAREHAELQHSIDSLAQHARIAPIAPALTDSINAKMQAQIDSISGLRGKALDRGFVQEQTQSHALMANYVAMLAGVAENPDVQALLASVATSVGSELGRARTLQIALAAADSASTADSLAKLSARHKRSTTDR